MNKKGFTLVEIMVVIALIVILSAISIPAISSWVPKYNLKGDVRAIYGAFSQAKAAAIKNNNVVVLKFDLANDSYNVWLDYTQPLNWAIDAATDRTINEGTTTNGIDLYECTIPWNTYGFSGRGLPHEDIVAGTYEIHLKNAKGQYMGVRVNSIGCISIISSEDGGATWN